MGKKDDKAIELARAHAEADSAIQIIVRYVSANEDDDGEPIKFLTCNAETTMSGTMPVYLGPGDDMPFPSIVVEVTADEFDRVGTADLKLPEGWKRADVLYERGKKE